jgi:hypothetical protein
MNTDPDTDKIVDFNIGLAIGNGEESLTIADINRELLNLGFYHQTHRVAQSDSELTYVVRCLDFALQDGPLAWRVFKLAAVLHQDAIAAVPHDGTPAICVGPAAHRWGGAFLPQHWISLA